MKVLSGRNRGYSSAYLERCERAAWLEGFVQGLSESLEVAKDYTGQGVLIAEAIRERIRKARG